jgi:hopanoid biosynthesis associated protein HpnK
MCQLIVHADDFGLSEKVNEGILQAHTRGILTSTSLMATGAAFDHAISIWQSNPTLDVGIHLTLVEEAPVVLAKHVPSLVKSKHQFHQNAVEFIKQYLKGKIRLQEVQLELEAQILKVINRGIRLSHIDSHQHIHMLPKIHEITVGLAKKFGIPAVRLTRETLHLGMLKEKGLFSRLFPLLVLNRFSRFPGDSDVARTDHFFGFFFSGVLNKTNLMKVLDHLPPSGICELMCHPGLDDPHSSYSHGKYLWQDELQALLDKELPIILLKKGITLISYRDLARQRGHH